MKKTLILFTLVASLLSCKQNEIELQHLNGYWEISKAESPNGKVKEFPMNENVEYFELKDSTGIRKKVRPQYSGKFKTSKNAETFTLQQKGGKLTIHYMTPYDEWDEQVLMLSAEKFVVKNKNGSIYTYTPYTGFKTFENEEE